MSTRSEYRLPIEHFRLKALRRAGLDHDWEWEPRRQRGPGWLLVGLALVVGALAAVLVMRSG